MEWSLQSHLPSFIPFIRQRWNIGCFGGSGCFRIKGLYHPSENAGSQKIRNVSKPYLSDTIILALGVITLLYISQLGPTHHPTFWSLCTAKAVHIYIYIIIIYIYNVPTQVGLVPTNKLTKGKLPAAKNGSCAIFKQAVSRLKPRFGFFQKDRGKTEIWIYTRIHHSKQIPRGHPSPIRNFYMGPGDQNPLNLKARAACQGHRGENPKNPHKSTLKCWTPPVLRQKFSSFRLKASMESGQLLSHVG